MQPSPTPDVALELRPLMSSNPVIVDRRATLDHVLELFECYGFRHLPVVECDRVLGMISDRDLRLATGLLPASRRLADGASRPLRGPEHAHDVMRAPVHCLPEEARVVDAIRCMLEHRIGAVPVVGNDYMVGIVTETDLLRAFVGLRCEEGAAAHLPGPMSSIAPDASVEEALAQLDQLGRHLGVNRGQRLVGILSERDLHLGLARNAIEFARAESEGRLPRQPLRVRDVMTTRLVTAEPETPLWRCAARMLDHRISALPVLDGATALGILTQREILQHFLLTLSPR